MKQKEAYRKGIAFQMVKPISLGPIISYSLLTDPIHLSFVLARYKFVARLLTGKRRVLEIGCGDAFGTPIVSEFVRKLVAIDADPVLTTSNKKRLSRIKNIEFGTSDFCNCPPKGFFDAVYSVDVLEHLDPPLNKTFFENSKRILTKGGICIIGTPNKSSERFATPQSKIQHINLQTHETLRDWMEKYFSTVFLFSMNDEVVHTGFFPMAQYLWGVGIL